MTATRLRGLWAWVPAPMAQMLDAARGPVLEPIRAELFGVERFEQHGRGLGASHRAGRMRFARASFYPRLQSNIRTLHAAYRYIAAQTQTGQDVSPAAEWLLDNFHLIDSQLLEIREGLPYRYYRSLPVLQHAPLVGLPRIYGVAWAFVAHTDSAFDETLLCQFLNAYQQERELSQGELWALPTTLRAVLIENLRRLADRLASHQAARELASLCAARLPQLPALQVQGFHAQMALRGVGDVFLTHLAQHLDGPASAPTPTATPASPAGGTSSRDGVRAWLAHAVPDLRALQARQHVAQAADHLSVSNAVTALRLIGAADWSDIVASTSRVIGTMMGSALFSAEDDATRNTTLHGIERLAVHSGREGSEVAQQLLQHMLAGEAGSALAPHWLQGPGRPVLERALGLKPRLGRLGIWWRSATTLARPTAYLLAVGLGTVLLVAAVLAPPAGVSAGTGPGAWLGLGLLALLMAWPASEAVVALLNRLISESVPPAHLPRLSLPQGIAPDARVLVVIPVLLAHPQAIEQVVHRLHLHHLANPEAAAQWALLSDWADADTPQCPGDQALLQQAQQLLQALNTRCPAAPGQPLRFLLLHRARSWCTTQGQWLGWERKRGKLEQLVAALATGTPGPFVPLGALSQLVPGTRYLLTLDSDTVLPPGCLRTLIGVAEHPQNQPRLDPNSRRVAQGYAILQPRVVAPLSDDTRPTAWQWLFHGERGLDPYSAMTSDVYQDLFGEGSFTGKGLLHVAAVHAVLDQRLPSECVLSHDLFEGALARCALVTDITLLEPEPTHADAAWARLHRWMRGDWQLLPLLLQRPAWPLGALNRWKLLDNLRRTLVAPACALLLVLSMAGIGLPMASAVALTLAAFAAGPLMGALAGAVPQHGYSLGARWAWLAGTDLLRALAGGIWHLALLPHQAAQSLDAVLRTAHRLLVSRRQLLAWTTAEAAHAGLSQHAWHTLWRHRSGPLLALAGALTLAATQPPAWGPPASASPLLALLVLGLWASAPLLVWATNRPWPSRWQRGVGAADRRLLLALGRDTWRLFERCIGPADHHLPPDNLQTRPHDMLAHRTSPTNIGLYLLSTACARRFGWIGTLDLLDRLEATAATLQQMERHHGHFLNWYDTQNLQPLLPRYVSTVDSGNLSAHLLAVAQACTELARQPGDLQASGEALAQSAARLHPRRAELQAALQQTLQQPWHLSALGRLLDTPASAAADPTTPALLEQAQGELQRLQPARAETVLHQPATPRDELQWWLGDHIATWRAACRDAQAWAQGQGPSARQRLQQLAHTFDTLAWAPDFRFLYHPRRHLLHIGYRLDSQTLDSAFYDLLASESRTTSLLGIAKGDLPPRHWVALGRPFFAQGRHAVLRSWSGSMFEYLMPLLVGREPRGSALQQAGQSALREQVAHARHTGMPWGISESAHAGRDHTLAYQYAPQGVPRLALRRTPPGERVVAPYATVLAAQLNPGLACQNLRALAALGMRGRYGCYEALDDSLARQTNGSHHTVVGTFMAHHQGMSIVAITNVLQAQVVQDWGMAHPRLQAVRALLYEKAPRELRTVLMPPDPGLLRHPPDHTRNLTPGAQALEPTHLLSNGRYSVTLRPNGAGWSRWGATGIHRWRDDALRDAHGSFIYLRLDRETAPVSVTSHPAPDPQARYLCRFQTDRVCFEARWPELSVHTTVWVSPEDDVELRKVTLVNHTDQPLALELLSAFDVTLAPAAADESHPAFSGLFIQAGWLPAQQALHFERTPRLQNEQALHMAHFVAHADGADPLLRLQTDRLHWLGRNHTAAQPLAQLRDAPEQAAVLDTGLDPVAALGLHLRLAPGASTSVTWGTAVSADRAHLLAVVDKYRQPIYVERASVMSATLAGLTHMPLRPRIDHLPVLHALTTALVLTLTRPASDNAPAADPTELPASDRRLLWSLGVSGDRPILLVHAGPPQGLGLLRVMALLLREWTRAGLPCDLVVLSAEAHSYHMPLQTEWRQLAEQHAADQRSRTGAALTGLHLLRTDEVSPAQRATLQALARVSLQADGQSLIHQVRTWCEQHRRPAGRHWLGRADQPVPLRLSAPHTGDTPAPPGAFSPDGASFSWAVSPTQRPARPWANVLANPGFGALVTEAGGGNTWALNSRLHQLTAWHNDPVADPPSEHWLLQDRLSGEVWSLTPCAWGQDQSPYHVTHTQGLTTIAHQRGTLAVTVSWCVDADHAVKQVRIRLHNQGTHVTHLRVTGLVEWLMGEKRSDRASACTQADFRAGPDSPLRALLCTQTDATGGFAAATAFLCEAHSALASSHDSLGGLEWTCDRREFFDTQGQLVLPQRLAQHSRPGLDPCAALSRLLTLRAGAQLEQVFLLGHAASPAAARQLIGDTATVPAAEREHRTQARWNRLLETVQVHTPDPLLNALVNRWLPYQTVSSRLWAKAGYYQAGGATGFRDQLQDAMSLVWADPQLLRGQIVLCASRQFADGDVQHWWHAPSGAGVRTHFSDDLLWLPLACTHYLNATADASVLDDTSAFLAGPPVPEGADDAYDTPQTSAETASVYEHAARAIDHSLRVGAHGLPLMGAGDWNDGMNRVGAQGRGESVWLAWFLCRIVSDWLPLARQRGEHGRALRWATALAGWQGALATHAWDGQWFRRAFFDDGTPLGASAQPEARIDLIAQAWSVLSGQASAAHQQQAMASVERLLVDPGLGLIRLLTPPLVHAFPNAGYIQAYPPGVRENGGQYAHAGVWALMAAAQLAQHGDAPPTAQDTPYRYFTYLSPAHRAQHAQWGAAYGLEPYAMAADVYSQPPWAGRGGWSWYTGAAGWMHRAVLESLLGLHLSATELWFRPCLPPDWPGAQLTLVRGERRLAFHLVRGTREASARCAAEPDAHRLQAGERLHWPALPLHSTVIVAF